MDKSLIRFFIILGFIEGDNPSREELKKRWKELCLKHHPDRGGDKEEFLKVTHAYDMITDPSYRDKHYVEEMRRSQHNVRGDLNIILQAPISFEDGFFGREILISYNRLEMTPEFNPIIKDSLEVEAVRITIPPGSSNGYRATFSGKGHYVNDTYGDLHVILAPVRHPTFTVVEEDVHSVERVPLDVLLKGGKVEVLTLWGMKTLRIPPATKPGTKLNIKSCGVLKLGKHVVTVDAIFPTRDDLKKDTWGFKINWEEVEKEDLEERSIRDAVNMFSSGTVTIRWGL